MLAISALLNTPQSVIIPANPQASSTRSADSNSADIGATFLYTPEPITELTVKMKAENNPSDLMRWPCGFCGSVIGYQYRKKSIVPAAFSKVKGGLKYRFKCRLTSGLEDANIEKPEKLKKFNTSLNVGRKSSILVGKKMMLLQVKIEVNITLFKLALLPVLNLH